MKQCKKHGEKPDYNCEDCIISIMEGQEQAIKEHPEYYSMEYY